MSAPASRPRHLVGVWNPTYEADAMDAHVALLLAAARDFRAGRRDESDVYVWWGKVRSSNRQQPLPHLDEILALDHVLASDGDGDDEPPELHLYLTDYRSLYVAHLAGVTTDDMSDDAGHVPAYYREKSLHCDCWLQLWDIRRLVLDDTPAVVHELAKLRNVRYHDRPVSIYGGMVELPLIVTRDDDGSFFDDRSRALLTDGRYWVEVDAERSGTGEMQRELRENRFGSEAWRALDPAARGFIASAEQLFRAHRADAAFDLSLVLVDFAKALEVQVNAILRRAMAGAEPRLRHEAIDGRSVDVTREGPFTLGQLARIIGGDRERAELLCRRVSDGGWFTDQLPSILERVATLRNPAAHGGAIDRGQVIQLRNQLVGVGHAGDLLRLAKVRPR